jgi:transposase
MARKRRERPPLVRNQACLPRPVRYAEQEGEFVAAVMIGIDPHKCSHTAVAVGPGEEQLGKLRVRACAEQARQLVEWAAAWPERAWAVEGARGLGHMLAQQLAAAGERVLDVQPELAAQVRLLASGDIDKNDPDDARSVAVAALRSASCPEVQLDGQAAVLKVRAERHRDLGRLRTQAACRLHAVLCELVPGGVRKEITAAHAARILEAVQPAGAVALARQELAGDFLEDLRRIDAQMAQTKKKLVAAVKASGTTLTEVFGVGPVIAAIALAEVQDVSRFPSRDHFAACNGTAPIEVCSGRRKVHRLSRRGNRRLNHAVHMAAITQIRHLHSDGRACHDKKLAEGKSSKEALRPQAAHQRRPLPAPARRRSPRCRGSVRPARGPGG